MKSEMEMKSQPFHQVMRFAVIPLLIFAAAHSVAKSESLPRKAHVQRVSHVIDGDTIILENGRHVRYIGIDCPEVAHARSEKKSEPFGKAAEKRNRKLVDGKTVRLEYDQEKTDRYGRALAYVFLSNGIFVNDLLVEEGLAHCLYDRKNTRFAEMFLKSQHNAMSSGKGVWGNRNLKKPYQVIGNRASRRFHPPHCDTAKQIAKRNRVVFPNRWKAFLEGYSPSKRCFFDPSPKKR